MLTLSQTSVWSYLSVFSRSSTNSLCWLLCYLLFCIFIFHHWLQSGSQERKHSISSLFMFFLASYFQLISDNGTLGAKWPKFSVGVLTCLTCKSQQLTQPTNMHMTQWIDTRAGGQPKSIKMCSWFYVPCRQDHIYPFISFTMSLEICWFLKFQASIQVLQSNEFHVLWDTFSFYFSAFHHQISNVYIFLFKQFLAKQLLNHRCMIFVAHLQNIFFSGKLILKYYYQTTISWTKSLFQN